MDRDKDKVIREDEDLQAALRAERSQESQQRQQKQQKQQPQQRQQTGQYQQRPQRPQKPQQTQQVQQISPEQFPDISDLSEEEYSQHIENLETILQQVGDSFEDSQRLLTERIHPLVKLKNDLPAQTGRFSKMIRYLVDQILYFYVSVINRYVQTGTAVLEGSMNEPKESNKSKESRESET